MRPRFYLEVQLSKSPTPNAAAVTIAIDAMGGDFGAQSAIPGAAIIQKKYPHVRFIMFGDQAKISPLLQQHGELARVSEVTHTDKMILGDDKPSAALRASKGTSMRMAIEAVKEGAADAVVSSGNTGALMAMAKMILKPVEGIHRPAIASVFPGLKGDTIMLDLGANVLVDAENLVQFAVLGAVFARAHKNIEAPTVGLLNVGSEETKGPDHVRGAAAILSKIEFPGKYYGFVEGNDITAGVVDVVVSDGYAGNIALKAAEGVGKLMSRYFKDALGAGVLARVGALLAYPSLKKLKNKIDPRLYNGGVFLGLNGLCIKSHGGSDEIGFSSALRLAVELSGHGYVQKVADDINHLMSQETFLAHGNYEV